MPKKMLLCVALLLLPSAPAFGTWSILLTNAETGEVAVGGATCLDGFDLLSSMPVVRVGYGVGAAQATPEPGAGNRIIMWNELVKGTHPQTILNLIQAADSNFQSRQIGIVDMKGQSVHFTGQNPGLWKGGLHGSTGPIRYVVIGNRLTGEPVIKAAEQAVINTPGDMAAKLMAGMQAARSMGGDGRCSCSVSAPTSCGSPPPSFTKSAHVGLMIVARIGDQEGTCGTAGCATGTYYLDLNVAGNQATKPDPVLQMQQSYNAWRTSLIGRPDHLKSNVHVSKSTLSMDTITHATLVIELVDWQGTPLNHGGDQVIVTQKPGSTAQVLIGAPVDHNDGTYSVNVFAGPDGGTVDLSVVVDDGGAGPPITLYPHTRLTVVEPGALATIDDDVGYLAGEDVPLVFHGGPGVGGHQYVILASLTGTSPPIVHDGVSVPLVFDTIFLASILAPNSPVFVNTLGWLDTGGSTSAKLVLHPGQLQPYVGNKLHFSCVLFEDEVDYASPPLSLDIVP